METGFRFQNKNWAFVPIVGALHSYQTLRKSDLKTHNLGLSVIHEWKVARWSYYAFVATPIVGTVAAFAVTVVAHKIFMAIYKLRLNEASSVDFDKLWEGAHQKVESMHDVRRILRFLAPLSDGKKISISWDNACFLESVSREEVFGQTVEACKKNGFDKILDPLRTGADTADILPGGAELPAKFLIKPKEIKEKAITEAKTYTTDPVHFYAFMEWLGDLPSREGVLQGHSFTQDEVGEIIQIPAAHASLLSHLPSLPRSHWASYIAMYREKPLKMSSEQVKACCGENFHLEILGLVEGNFSLLPRLKPCSREALIALKNRSTGSIESILAKAETTPLAFHNSYVVVASKDLALADDLMSQLNFPGGASLFLPLSSVQDKRKILDLFQGLEPLPDDLVREAVPLLANWEGTRETLHRIWPELLRLTDPAGAPYVLRYGLETAYLAEFIDRINRGDGLPRFYDLLQHFSVEQAIHTDVIRINSTLLEVVPLLPAHLQARFINSAPPVENRPNLAILLAKAFQKEGDPTLALEALKDFGEEEAMVLCQMVDSWPMEDLPKLTPLKGKISPLLQEVEIESFDQLALYAEHIDRRRLREDFAPCMKVLKNLPHGRWFDFTMCWQYTLYKERFIETISGLTPEEKEKFFDFYVFRVILYILRIETPLLAVPRSNARGPESFYPEELHAIYANELHKWGNYQFQVQFASAFLQNRTFIPTAERLGEIASYFTKNKIDPWSTLAADFIRIVERASPEHFDGIRKILTSTTACTIYKLLPDDDKGLFLASSELERWDGIPGEPLHRLLESVPLSERYSFIKETKINDLKMALNTEDPLKLLRLLQNRPDLRPALVQILPYYSFEILDHFEGANLDQVWLMDPRVLHLMTENQLDSLPEGLRPYAVELWKEIHTSIGGFLPSWKTMEVNLEHYQVPVPELMLDPHLTYEINDLLLWFDLIPTSVIRKYAESKYSPRYVRSGLERLLYHCKNAAPCLGTPPAHDTVALNRFHRNLETILKNGMKVLKKRNDPEVTANYLAALGIAGHECAARWMGEATFQRLQAMKGIQIAPRTPKEEIYFILGLKRIEIFEQLIGSYSNTHFFADYSAKLGEMFGIPGLEATEEALYNFILPGRLIDKFKEKYSPTSILIAHLKNGTSGSNVTSEWFQEWMFEQKPKDWEPDAKFDGSLPANFKERATEVIKTYEATMIPPLNLLETDTDVAKAQKKMNHLTAERNRKNLLIAFFREHEMAPVYKIEDLDSHMQTHKKTIPERKLKWDKQQFTTEVLFRRGKLRPAAACYLLAKHGIMRD